MKPPGTPENTEPKSCGGVPPLDHEAPQPAIGTKGKIVVRIRAKPRKPAAPAAAEGEPAQKASKVISPRLRNGQRGKASAEGHEATTQREEGGKASLTPAQAADVPGSIAPDCNAPTPGAAPAAAMASLVPRSTAKRRGILTGNIAAAVSLATLGVSGEGASGTFRPPSSSALSSISSTPGPTPPPVGCLASVISPELERTSSPASEPPVSTAELPSFSHLASPLLAPGQSVAKVEVDGMDGVAIRESKSASIENSGVKYETEEGGGTSACWWSVLINNPEDTSGNLAIEEASPAINPRQPTRPRSYGSLPSSSSRTVSDIQMRHCIIFLTLHNC